MKTLKVSFVIRHPVGWDTRICQDESQQEKRWVSYFSYFSHPVFVPSSDEGRAKLF